MLFDDTTMRNVGVRRRNDVSFCWVLGRQKIHHNDHIDLMNDLP